MGAAAASGAAGGAASGAVTGTMIAPGIGTAIGAVAGGALGALGGAFGDSSAKKNAKALKEAQDAQNAANQARYEQLLRISDQSRMDQLGFLNSQYGQLYNMLDSQGLDANLSRARATTQSNIAQTNQGLASRGLFNSSTAANAVRAARNEGALRESDIYNNVLAQRMGLAQRYTDLGLNTLSNTANMKAGYVEGRNDGGASASQYAALLSQPTANPYSQALTSLGQGASLYALLNQQQKPQTTYSASSNGAGATPSMWGIS